MSGDKIYSVNLAEIANQEAGSNQVNFINFDSTTLVSTDGLVETTIVNAIPITKDSYLYFNGEVDIKFSLEQPMFVKKDQEFEIIPSGIVAVGDYLIKIDENGNIVQSLVESIDIVEETSNMFLFDCEPQDWFIAGGYLVHNK